MPKKPIGNSFLIQTPLPTFTGQPTLRGELHDIDGPRLHASQVQPLYTHPQGSLVVGDSLRWLATLEPGSVDLIFADPPYNIGKADWDEFASHDDYLQWSLQWIELASRALTDHGSLYVCGFSEILADLRRPASVFFHGCRWLIWHYKNKANLSNDWGRSHESIIHFRKGKTHLFNVDDVRIPYGSHTLKYPTHPQAASSQYSHGKKDYNSWQPHPKGAKPKDVFEIPVTSNGMVEKTPHPTRKPEELLRRVILASSRPGDLVADPFVGSGTTLVCAQQLQRRWVGCDINPEYGLWTAARLENVPTRSIEEWINYDRTIARRRESIR